MGIAGLICCVRLYMSRFSLLYRAVFGSVMLIARASTMVSGYDTIAHVVM